MLASSTRKAKYLGLVHMVRRAKLAKFLVVVVIFVLASIIIVLFIFVLASVIIVPFIFVLASVTIVLFIFVFSLIVVNTTCLCVEICYGLAHKADYSHFKRVHSLILDFPPLAHGDRPTTC